jgi:hypothetical protein
MVRLVAPRLALVVALLALASPARAASTRRAAILIGHNQGDGSRPALRFAELDARKLAHTLIEVGGVAKEDLRLQTGSSLAEVRAALADLQQRLRRWRREAPADRQVLLVFFSGHSDGQALELGRERLPFGELLAWIRGVGADVRVVILDTCKSGSLLASKGGSPGAPFALSLSDDLAARGEAILTSTAADEVALESEAIRGSFFSHHLVSGLRGAADANGDGRVTLAEAYHYAAGATLNATASSIYGPQHAGFDLRMTGHDDVVLAEPSPRTSRLALPEGFDRLFVVRVGVDQVLAELNGRAPARTLALRPGVYGLRAWKGARLFTGEVTVAAGEWRTLRAGELAAAELADGPAPFVPARPDGPWRLATQAPVAVPAPIPPPHPGALTAAPLAGPCSYSCEVDTESGHTTCQGAIRRIESEGPRSVFVVSMEAARTLELSVELCDPRGYVLLVADSAGCDGGGGDNNETFYDAEIELRDTTLSVYANDLGPRPAAPRAQPLFVPARGCSHRTLQMADGWFYDGTQPPFPMSSLGLLRIDPPPAAEGIPDALWYVGVNRTVYRRDREGAGVRHLRFCQRR